MLLPAAGLDTLLKRSHSRVYRRQCLQQPVPLLQRDQACLVMVMRVQGSKQARDMQHAPKHTDAHLVALLLR